MLLIIILLTHHMLMCPSSAAPVDSTTPASALTKQTPIVTPKPQQNVAAAAGSKEFDPLSSQKSVDENQQKVMSSFGIPEGNNKNNQLCYILNALYIYFYFCTLRFLLITLNEASNQCAL